MKKLLIVLGLVLSQASFAAPSVIDTFTNLLPFGRHDGDDCRVSMSYTLKGNLKVTVANLVQRQSYILGRFDYYNYLPGRHLVLRDIQRSGTTRSARYFFFSYVDGKRSVLIGTSKYSPSESYDYNVECTVD